MIVRLRGKLVEILVDNALEVYGRYVWENKKGEKVLLVQCMNALYGTMKGVSSFLQEFCH